VDKDTLVIGLAGSFGSGCSTLAEALRIHHEFEVFSLTTFLKSEWQQRCQAAGQAEREATRRELQDLGNELRESHGRDTLARKAVEEAKKSGATGRIVFDSIKNLGEVSFLRDSFRDFFLVVVQCSSPKRWKRVERRYKRQGLGFEDFESNDLRDQIEADLPHGQQVQICVDEADIVISNEEQCDSRQEGIVTLETRAEPYLGLVTKDRLRYPSLEEVMMGMAYMQATRSQCIKRQVGAVIVDDQENIVSAGFNEKPPPLEPCGQRLVCEKESKMLGQIEALEGTECRRCSAKLSAIAPPYVCGKCGVSLTEVFSADRGAQWCPAIHAEDSAIRQAPRRDLHDCTLYTTTFPCFNCAKAITFAGIKRVVYVEPYPDGDSAELLEKTGRNVLLFEGVKARAFHRLFAPIQGEMERRYSMKI